jgi:D-glycero-alpha-D-manno-heptose-7-phosphate kinase
MIIARSPLRISLGGGGTDLPSYYREHGGSLIAAAIDKFVYVSLTPTLLDHLLIRYSKIEAVASRHEIQHPIIREALALMGIDETNIEITTMADVPAGTGLGSSGSFTTALLAALHRYRRRFIGQHDLAELACEIEIDRLGEPVGKQDQYVAVAGGVTWLEFNPDDSVDVRSLELPRGTIGRMRDQLLLFSTGISRSAGQILLEQDRGTRGADKSMVANLHRVKEIGIASRDALLTGNLRLLGELMHEHWAWKKQRSKSMSSEHIDDLYECGRKHGAIGGKLIGAGGGGFMMFCTSDPEKLRAAMFDRGLAELSYDFAYEGTRVLVS